MSNLAKAQAVGAVLIIVMVSMFLSIAVVKVLQSEQRQGSQIDEHRNYNQHDHDAICAMLQAQNVRSGLVVPECGSGGR